MRSSWSRELLVGFDLMNLAATYLRQSSRTARSGQVGRASQATLRESGSA
jgi:hypothetical protein